MAAGGGRDAVVTLLDAQFVGWMKALLTMGAALSQASGCRDLFTQMVEKVRDKPPFRRPSVHGLPAVQVWTKLRQTGAGPSETQTLFRTLLDTFGSVSRIAERHRTRYASTWARFLRGVQACVLHFYARDTGHLDPV
jgi:hypothetical protein